MKLNGYPSLQTLDAAAKFQKRSIKDTCVEASEKVVLTAELTSESASVTWFRDGVQLTEGSKYEMKKDGLSRTLVVKSTEAKDGGTTDTSLVSPKSQAYPHT